MRVAPRRRKLDRACFIRFSSYGIAGSDNASTRMVLAGGTATPLRQRTDGNTREQYSSIPPNQKALCPLERAKGLQRCRMPVGLCEEDADLALSGLRGVGAVNNILVHNQTEIAANRAGGSFSRISGAHEGAHLGDGCPRRR